MVRPTLLTVWPTVATPSPVIDHCPVMVSERPGRAVCASRPMVKAMPLAYEAREESLRRQRRPAGQAPPVA